MITDLVGPAADSGVIRDAALLFDCRTETMNKRYTANPPTEMHELRHF